MSEKECISEFAGKARYDLSLTYPSRHEACSDALLFSEKFLDLYFYTLFYFISWFFFFHMPTVNSGVFKFDK